MKTTKPILIIFLCGFVSLLLSAAEPASTGYKPKDGFVPDKETAIKIAVAVWTPIYGQKKIEAEAPYSVRLEADVWIVDGSLPKSYFTLTAGGTAHAEIAKADGRIIKVIHGK